MPKKISILHGSTCGGRGTPYFFQIQTGTLSFHILVGVVIQDKSLHMEYQIVLTWRDRTKQGTDLQLAPSFCPRLGPPQGLTVSFSLEWRPPSVTGCCYESSRQFVGLLLLWGPDCHLWCRREAKRCSPSMCFQVSSFWAGGLNFKVSLKTFIYFYLCLCVCAWLSLCAPTCV